MGGMERAVKSTQEQAIASWITYLNQMRLDEFIRTLNQQDINLESALEELAKLKEFIGDPSHILGNSRTKHGEIAEHIQVIFANARNVIQGLAKTHTFEGVGRTAPEDYIRAGQQVQSKFYNGARQTFFGNHALAEHLETYPNFIKNGGSYDIPKDQYERVVDLLKTLKKHPSQLSTSDYNLAKKINEFLREKNLELGKDINPAVVDYNEVQQGVVNDTINNEEKSIRKEDFKRRKQAYDASKPTFKEGAKAAGISAGIEGGVSFCMAIAKKRKEGKQFSEFTEEDWIEVCGEGAFGTLKGGVRGGAIYTITNFTATSANVASAYVTAMFGVLAQVRAYKNGELSKEDFVINSEVVCLDVTVSAIASLSGQVLIPIPVLGAVIGNIAGEFVYEICKQRADKKEMDVISAYKKEMDILNQQLDIQLQRVIFEIRRTLNRFIDLEQMAFDVDVNKAFCASILLAREVGVEEVKILKTRKDIDNYFMA